MCAMILRVSRFGIYVIQDLPNDGRVPVVRKKREARHVRNRLLRIPANSALPNVRL
jgi:hypothetical protein